MLKMYIHMYLFILLLVLVRSMYVCVTTSYCTLQLLEKTFTPQTTSRRTRPFPIPPAPLSPPPPHWVNHHAHKSYGHSSLRPTTPLVSRPTTGRESRHPLGLGAGAGRRRTHVPQTLPRRSPISIAASTTAAVPTFETLQTPLPPAPPRP